MTPLVTAMLTCSLNLLGCLAPVAPPSVTGSGNGAPFVDLDTIAPPGSVFEVNPMRCDTFSLRVDAIRDLDDEALLLRWIANNQRSNTRIIGRTTSSIRPLGDDHSTFVRVNLNSDFQQELDVGLQPGGTGVGVLSLFVTDAEGTIVALDAQRTSNATLTLPLDTMSKPQRLVPRALLAESCTRVEGAAIDNWQALVTNYRLEDYEAAVAMPHLSLIHISEPTRPY